MHPFPPPCHGPDRVPAPLRPHLGTPSLLRLARAQPPAAPLSRTLGSLRRWLRAEHHAWGDRSNVITFGFEHEGNVAGGVTNGRRWGVLDHYREPEVSQQEWLRLGGGEGDTRAERYAQLDQARTDRIHQRGPDVSPWTGLVRMDGSPDFLGTQLATDCSLHETTPSKLTRTLNAFFEQVGWVKRNIEPTGRTQYNVGFRHNSAYAEQLAVFTAQAAEYATLRMAAGSPRGLHNPMFGMYSAEGLSQLTEKLRSPTPELEGPDVKPFKYRSVTLRSGPKYGPPGTLVLEVRALTNNVADPRRVVMSAVRFLENPDRALVRLGRRSVGHRVDDLRTVDRLDGNTARRLPAASQRLLGTVKSLGDHPTNLWLSGAIPMVAWERRPGIPAEVQKTIVRERARFVATMEHIARNAGDKPTLHQIRPRVLDAVHTFAKNTGLHEYL